MVLIILSSCQCRGLLLTAASWCRCLLPLCVFFFWFPYPCCCSYRRKRKENKRAESWISLSLCVSNTHTKKEEVDQQALLFVTEERAHTRAQLHSCFDFPILLSLFFFFTPSLPFCFFDTYCKYTHTHTHTHMGA